MNRPTLLWLHCALFATTALGLPRLAGAQQAPVFNTVKQKLAEGHQVVGATVATADADIYCAVANSGFDFIWIEMQHSPLTYTDAARMIWACRGAPAIPFIRVAGGGTMLRRALRGSPRPGRGPLSLTVAG